MHILIGIPTYDATVRVNTVHSLSLGVRYLAENGVGADFAFTRSTMIERARDNLAARLLAHDKATHLLFIDSDVGWDMEALGRLVESSDKAIVAGVYPMRSFPITFPYVPLPGAKVDDRGLLEVACAPTGFMLIRREVIEDMSKDAVPYMDGINEVRRLFYSGVVDSVLYGEDMNFCRLWRDKGGQVYIIPDMTLGHMGPHEFKGNLASTMHLLKKSAYAGL